MNAFTITKFPNFAAASKSEHRITLEYLAQRIRETTARRKDDLPWLKLARFGDKRTDANSLRHDANVLAITGIEADYDAERMTFDEAQDILEKQGILALLYTSPSHTEDAPHWRALCPLSSELPPERRNHQLGRLNGLFRGIFAGESWTLSQSYYFGSVANNPSHRVEIIDGTPIDQHDDLDQIWLGKPGAGHSAISATGDAREDAELIRCIVTGEHFHVELCALAARYIGRNIPPDTVEELLRGIMLALHGEGDRDERWFDRYYSIPELVASALQKYRADDQEKRKSVVALACDLTKQRRLSTEIRTEVYAKAEASGISRQAADSIIAWAARKELARRGVTNVAA